MRSKYEVMFKVKVLKKKFRIKGKEREGVVVGGGRFKGRMGRWVFFFFFS